MAEGRRNDPYRNYKFTVQIDGFTSAYFKAVRGLQREVEVIEYSEGGEPERHRKIPGIANFPAITLERGMTEDLDFMDWANQVYNIGAGFNQSEDFRRDLIINLHGRNGSIVRSWAVYDAWPSNYSVDDLEREGGGDILIMSLELSHEGLEEITPP